MTTREERVEQAVAVSSTHNQEALRQKVTEMLAAMPRAPALSHDTKNEIATYNASMVLAMAIIMVENATISGRTSLLGCEMAGQLVADQFQRYVRLFMIHEMERCHAHP